MFNWNVYHPKNCILVWENFFIHYKNYWEDFPKICGSKKNFIFFNASSNLKNLLVSKIYFFYGAVLWKRKTAFSNSTRNHNSIKFVTCIDILKIGTLLTLRRCNQNELTTNIPRWFVPNNTNKLSNEINSSHLRIASTFSWY